MKKRLITGIGYVIVMAGLLVMKLLIPDKDGMDYGGLGVDLLFWAISIIGAYEFTRAVGEHSPADSIAGAGSYISRDEDGAPVDTAAKTGGISKAQRWVAIVTCGLLIPTFVISKMVAMRFGKSQTPSGIALVLLLAVGSLGAMIIASLTVFDHENSDLKSTAYAELCLLYCGGLTCVGSNINHLIQNSDVAILLLFILVPFVDTGAFFVGKLFGKLLPLKLAPKTSPNKTVVGAAGGVLGGIVAAVVTWVICEYAPCVNFDYNGSMPKIVALIIISIPTSILAQLGDLFESAIKRGCGVKDMGNILPGHGGMLDRFDSMLFATVSIIVCFMAIR